MVIERTKSTKMIIRLKMATSMALKMIILLKMPTDREIKENPLNQTKTTKSAKSTKKREKCESRDIAREPKQRNEGK